MEMEKALEMVSGELNRRIEAEGMDALIAQAEIVYASMYRSEPYPASKVDVEHWPELSEEIRNNIIDSAFDKEFPDFNEEMEMAMHDDDDSRVYQMDAWKESWVDENEDKFPNIVITKDTLLVDIVNYKGEGEGVSLFDMTKSLKTFVSKYNYI